MTEPGTRVPARRLLQIAAIVLVVAAVAWVVRGIPLAEIAGALRRLTVGEIVVLLCVNIGITFVFTLRWWVILRAQGHRIPLIRLSTYRLAGFALSYLTPGTQFGGEPLQIALCHRRHAVPTPDATAAVIIDRAVEMLGNFTFLAFGLVLSLRLRLIPDEGGRWLGFVAAALLFIPLVFLAAALTGRKPVTGLLRWVPTPTIRRSIGWARFVGWVEATEEQIITFCRERPKGLATAMGLSLVGWLAIVFEYGLMLLFLDVHLDLMQTIGGITAGRLALLVPVPGGFGALETSQALALAALGYSRAEGLGLGLLIRARDLVFAFAGLAFGAWYARRMRVPPARRQS